MLLKAKLFNRGLLNDQNLSIDLTASEYDFNEDCIKNGAVNIGLIYGKNTVGIQTLLCSLNSIMLDIERTMTTTIDCELTFKFNGKIVEFKTGDIACEEIEEHVGWLLTIKRIGELHYSKALCALNDFKEDSKCNFQILISTNNTVMMTNDILRPDCYFVMDGNKAESIDNLTKKELKKSHNIEKMFRAGAFKNG